MRALLIGRRGQLACELGKSRPEAIDLEVLGSDQLDVTDTAKVFEKLNELKPDCVLNASAYTAVDKAETDKQSAYAINSLGVKNLAEACAGVGCRLLHVSTDFVFGGAQNRPYKPDDETGAQSVYGASKLEGEQHVRSALPSQSIIVRTAWVYSVHGNNFVKTMLRLMQEKPQLGVIYDQVGSPTWAKNLAIWLWTMAVKPEVSGTFHWTDAGVASWYDFAVAIQALGIEKGLLRAAIPIKPIPTSAYPTPAARPAYSVLDKTTACDVSGLETRHWREQLSLMLDELRIQ